MIKTQCSLAIMILAAISGFCQVDGITPAWAQSIKGQPVGEDDVITDICTDAENHIYVTGYFSKSSDFDPSLGIHTLTSKGATDFFLAKYEANGDLIWAFSAGSSGSDQGFSIGIDAAGDIIVAGVFSDTVDFDPSPDDANLIGSPEAIFFAKYDSDGNSIWARQIAGYSSVISGLQIDDENNILLAGEFRDDNADFDPGPGEVLLTPAIDWDMYIAKYDPDGNYVWVKQIGGGTDSELNDINLDEEGFIYVTGDFTGTVDFDPGAGVANLSSAGTYDLFFAKYDNNGMYQFAKKIGGTGASVISGEIEVGPLNEIYIKGLFSGTVDFNPGAAVNQIIGVAWDVFMARYDASGNYVWAYNYHRIDKYAEENDMQVDASGNLYLTGVFSFTQDFNPGGGVYNVVTTQETMFFAKYDNGGLPIWVKSMKPVISSHFKSSAILLDNDGSILIAGRMYGEVDFDTGADTLILDTYSINDDGYIIKYNSTGDILWGGLIGRYSSVSYSDYARDIEADHMGNVYITGLFRGLVDFDNSEADAILLSRNGPESYDNSSYLAKYNSTGDLAWVYQFDTTDTQTGYTINDISVDQYGNLYTTGLLTASGGADIDPGPGVYMTTTDLYTDILIVKYDPAGDLIWAKQINCSVGGGGGYSIKFDADSNLVVGGGFSGTADFDTGPDIYNLTSAGVADIFLTKYDTDGNYMWSTRMGGSGDDRCLDVEVDQLNQICIFGLFSSMADFDPGPGVYHLVSAGLLDMYLAKYDVEGNFLWANSFVTASTIPSRDMAIDSENNIYITGELYNTIDFDAGPGSFNLTTSGLYDIFLAKYSPAGMLLWAFGIGNTETTDIGAKVTVDADDHVYLSGSFGGTVDFDPGPGVYYLNAMETDICVAKYTESGELIFADRMGGDDYDVCEEQFIDDNGNFYIAGHFQSPNADMDPGVEELLIQNGGYNSGSDIYFAKYYLCPIFYYADMDGDGFGIADSIVAACDDVPPPGYSDNTSDCNDTNHLIFPGADEICNSIDDNCNGLTDESGITAMITPAGPTTICTGSTVTLNANTGAGYVYQWKKNNSNIPGATTSSYTTNKAAYYQVKITSASCLDISDSLQVIVNPKPNANITNVDATNDLCLDPSIKLKANSGAGFTYQWYKGAGALAGAVNPVYFAAVPGNYKVKVVNAYGCEKISSPYQIIETCKLGDAAGQTEMVIYPNPAASLVAVTVSGQPQGLQKHDLVVIDAEGRVVMKIEVDMQDGYLFYEMDVNDLPAGLYLLKITGPSTSNEKSFIVF